jgi:hypothetical protein
MNSRKKYFKIHTAHNYKLVSKTAITPQPMLLPTSLVLPPRCCRILPISLLIMIIIFNAGNKFDSTGTSLLAYALEHRW